MLFECFVVARAAAAGSIVSLPPRFFAHREVRAALAVRGGVNNVVWGVRDEQCARPFYVKPLRRRRPRIVSTLLLACGVMRFRRRPRCWRRPVLTATYAHDSWGKRRSRTAQGVCAAWIYRRSEGRQAHRTPVPPFRFSRSTSLTSGAAYHPYDIAQFADVMRVERGLRAQIPGGVAASGSCSHCWWCAPQRTHRART